jgi:D-alanine-D-alanine ligase
MNAHEVPVNPPRPAAGRSDGKVRVAVVFGGRSGEHSVSCATAAGVLREIDRDRFDVVPIGITRSGRWVAVADDPVPLEGGRADVADAGGTVVIPPSGAGAARLWEVSPGTEPRDLGEVDVVLPLLHGPFGEDGTIQGLLEMADLHYVGSGVLSSAVGMDKHFMKVALEAAGLPVGPYVVVTPQEWSRDRAAALDAVAALGFPVFVKPARAGSSLGIARVERVEDVEAAIVAAQRHDPKVIVEAGVPGREIECGVLGGRDGARPRTAPPGEIVMHEGAAQFYDFETKYFSTEGFHMECPAALDPGEAGEIRDLAVQAFEALGCEGLARVDFFLEGGRAIVNEVNTMPGFTPFSMFPVMWASAGMDYRELVTELIELALARPTGLR